MVRATATKTAPAASEAKKAAPAAKKEKTTTPATKKEKAVAAAPAPVAAPVVAEKADETVAAEETDKNTPTAALMEEIAVFNTNFAMCQSAVNAMKANLKNITKLADRVSKNAAKSKKRKNTNTGKKSGFEKPTLISDDLAAFLVSQRVPLWQEPRLARESTSTLLITTYRRRRTAESSTLMPSLEAFGLQGR